MRRYIIGLGAAAAVGIAVVAVATHSPPAVTKQHAGTTTVAGPAGPPRVFVPAPLATGSVPAKLGSYPTNVPVLLFKAARLTFPGPTTVTFPGRLILNGVGVQTTELRIFSVRDHTVVATVSTDSSGAYTAKIDVTKSDWFFAMYSGTDKYQPALSGVARITIGSRPGH